MLWDLINHSIFRTIKRIARSIGRRCALFRETVPMNTKQRRAKSAKITPVYSTEVTCNKCWLTAISFSPPMCSPPFNPAQRYVLHRSLATLFFFAFIGTYLITLRHGFCEKDSRWSAGRTGRCNTLKIQLKLKYTFLLERRSVLYIHAWLASFCTEQEKYIENCDQNQDTKADGTSFDLAITWQFEIKHGSFEFGIDWAKYSLWILWLLWAADLCYSNALMLLG